MELFAQGVIFKATRGVHEKEEGTFGRFSPFSIALKISQVLVLLKMH